MKLAINSYKTNNQPKQMTFKSISMVNFNKKYKNIENLLNREIEIFANGGNNTTKIGEGIGGETYKFNTPKLSKIVIKKNKKEYNDNYSKEYENLESIPTDRIGGQEAIARVFDYKSKKYFLVSSLVEGKILSRNNGFSDSHLNSLFTKMFELDKLGIYHGDLNGKNILLNPKGEVNFIDYQWTQKVPNSELFSDKEILLPESNFPENAQMLEMALMPWYIDQLSYYTDKEDFMTKYLEHKSIYHANRANFIKNNKHILSRYNDYSTIIDAIDFEDAKSKVYKRPNIEILKLEMKKIQFLSDYRDAYSHLDPNNPDRNILPSTSAYLCAISAIQDFRKEVYSQLWKTTDSNKKKYLESMEEYGNYWYNKLMNYSSDSFDYIIRATSKNLKSDEKKHQFYLNDRNPHNFEPNRDILLGTRQSFAPTYSSNFNVPVDLYYDIYSLYKANINKFDSMYLYDEKFNNKIKKIISVSEKTENFFYKNTYLDLLNVSQLGILKIREFRSYAKENISNYTLNSQLNDMLKKSIEFTQNLYNTMYKGLEEKFANNIKVKGYEHMRFFTNRI